MMAGINFLVLRDQVHMMAGIKKNRDQDQLHMVAGSRIKDQLWDQQILARAGVNVSKFFFYEFETKHWVLTSDFTEQA